MSLLIRHDGQPWHLLTGHLQAFRTFLLRGFLLYCACGFRWVHLPAWGFPATLSGRLQWSADFECTWPFCSFWVVPARAKVVNVFSKAFC